MSGPVSIKPPTELQDDIFPLKANHMALLQKYVNSGVQLPITVADYTKEFTLAQATVTKFKTNVEAIVKVYGECQKHTRNYKDNIHPSTVSLASDLVNYAKDAELYYKAIYDAIQELDNKDLTPAEVLKKKQRVGALVDEQVSTMDDMVKKADQIVLDLKEFEKETTGDQTSLLREEKSLSAKLDDSDGEIARLEKEVNDLQKAIDTAQKAYEDTLDKIADIPKWGWIPYVGWITAGIKGSQWSKEAKELASKMNQDKSQMDAKRAEIESCKNMKIQATTMDRDLKRLLEMIAPAIVTIQLMQGAFGSIADDLNVVKKKVDEDIRDSKAIIADVQIEAVTASWKSLGARGDQYRQIAYVGTFDV